MAFIFSRIMDKFTHDDDLKIEEMSLEELEEERASVRADMELKRDKHEGLAEKRRSKFDRLRDTEEELLREELAEEVASIEDEMSIYHNEHAQMMDALRVIDGLIAVKRKQNLLEDEGLVQELENMDRQEVMEALKKEEVQEMIKEEKWSDLRDLFRGQLEPKSSGNKRVREIIASADKDGSADEILRRRDQERGHNIH